MDSAAGRQFIAPGTRLPVSFSSRERTAILERTLLDPEMAQRLRAAVGRGSESIAELTLDDIDELLGCVAAEANHTADGKLQRLLDVICDRLSMLLGRYTDERPAHAAATAGPAPFTEKQGQYLAFIHYYGKVHRQPPAEADLQRFFNVSAPAVHTMIVTLERRGLIRRTPGRARSIELCVRHEDLPELR